MMCKIAKTARRASSDRRPFLFDYLIFLFDYLTFSVAGLRERKREWVPPKERKRTKEEKKRKNQRKEKKKERERENTPLPSREKERERAGARVGADAPFPPWVVVGRLWITCPHSGGNLLFAGAVILPAAPIFIPG